MSRCAIPVVLPVRPCCWMEMIAAMARLLHSVYTELPPSLPPPSSCHTDHGYFNLSTVDSTATMNSSLDTSPASFTSALLDSPSAVPGSQLFVANPRCFGCCLPHFSYDEDGEALIARPLLSPRPFREIKFLLLLSVPCPSNKLAAVVHALSSMANVECTVST
jgi:hypothetical protein